MHERALDLIRRKLVQDLWADPPQAIPAHPLAPGFDRWMAAHFDADEVRLLSRIELEYGARAVNEWFAEAVIEAALRLRAAA